MAIPNTTTFTMLDVQAETGRSNLASCLIFGVPENFDPAYGGNKDCLLNFRNYKTPSVIVLTGTTQAGEYAWYLTWTATTGNYEVWRQLNTMAYIKLLTTSLLYYNDTGLLPKNFHYKVTGDGGVTWSNIVGGIPGIAV